MTRVCKIMRGLEKILLVPKYFGIHDEISIHLIFPERADICWGRDIVCSFWICSRSSQLACESQGIFIGLSCSEQAK